MDSPFHPGELRAQQLAGQRSSGAAIRDFMPDQHRDFYAMLPFVLVATVAADGWPEAAVLTGTPGFVSSPDATTLQVRAALAATPGTRIGLLGLDFATRRRNRANGVIGSIDAQGFRIDLAQSFGNCPKYIRQRDVVMSSLTALARAEVEGHVVSEAQAGVVMGAQATLRFAGLDAQARHMVAAADTFFVATSSGAFGADMSHRGGPPGFVHIDGDTLTVPDFAGNRYFNTLGNMLTDDRAALLFIDYANGDLLQLSGRSEVVWDAAAAAAYPGAERLWRLRVERGQLRRGAVPLRWREREAVADGLRT